MNNEPVRRLQSINNDGKYLNDVILKIKRNLSYPRFIFIIKAYPTLLPFFHLGSKYVRYKCYICISRLPIFAYSKRLLPLLRVAYISKRVTH
jgi:hypothetical protein